MRESGGIMYGLIMAGGIGKRFWPWSRGKNPKQFLKISEDKTMLRKTFERLSRIMEPENIYIITNKMQKKMILLDLPEIAENNIIVEPFGKDTAPCIGLGSLFTGVHDPEAIQVVVPADHLIENEKEFKRIVLKAAQFVEKKECLMTIGIKPARPETGYGYIQYCTPEKQKQKRQIYKVKTFAEKPNLETADRFIRSGDFLWNSGIFIWKAKTILNEIENSLPELYAGLMDINKYMNTDSFSRIVRRVYRQTKSISIDYGVMEKAKDVWVIEGDFGWSDVGSWEEYYNLGIKDKNNNFIKGKGLLLDSTGNLVFSEKKLIAGIDLENLIIIDTKDALLIVPRDKSQRVKDLVDHLSKKNMREVL